MIMAPLKTFGLVFLLLVPFSAPSGAAQGPKEDEIAVMDDDAFELDLEDEGEPLILRHRMHLGGGFIGIRLLGMTPELRAHYGAPRDAGVLVSEVEPDSPAARAGIQVGDIITQASGERIDSIGDLFREVRGKAKGESLDLDVSRGRSTQRLTVTVEERQGSRIGPKGKRAFRHLRTRDFGSLGPLLNRSEGLSRLQERLEEMEKRLKELEKKLGTR